MTMERSEVDSTIKDILSGNKVDDKAREKKADRFFHLLGGGDSPLEAVQLFLGRNEKLQYAQLKTATEIVKFLDPFKVANVKFETFPALVRVLLKTNLFKLILRLLRLHIPDSCICESVSWKSIYPNSLTILRAIIDLSFKVENFTATLVKNDTVELLIEYLDGDIDILTVFPSICGLNTLCTVNNEARERVIFANGLSKMGHLLLKDNSQKMHFKAYRQGLNECQAQEMDRVHRLYVDEDLFVDKKFIGRNDISYHVLKNWSRKIQIYASRIILNIADQNDRHKKLVFEDKLITKALMKWVKSPVILQWDSEMIETSLRILENICYIEEITWKLVEKYDIIKYLEYGVNYPDRNLFLRFLGVIVQLAVLGGKCRNAVLESNVILQTLSMSLFSHDEEIQNVCVNTLGLLIETSANSASEKVIHSGISPKSIMLFSHFYEYEAQILKTLKQCLSKKGSRLWKNKEAQFGKTQHEFLQTLDAEQAVRLKDIGNDKFKNREYTEAIEFYSKALDVCPPAVRGKKEGKNCWNWWVVPAALHSNRAQAYLKTRDWTSAYMDCKRAIARCKEGNPEATEILTKTAYRRAKALLELGNYQEALNDISLCLQKKYKDNDVRSLFSEIITKYRKFVGIEPIRRCAVCMEGEGEKLKRCANCNEVYCSRECQLFAWDTGHKSFCNEKV